MERILENMSLAEEEKEELIIVLEDFEAGIDVLDHCLIGRFLTDQPINFQAMKTHMATVWRPQKGVVIKEVYDLPLGYNTETIGKLLGNFVGSFIDYDKSNCAAAWRPYMRIRVAINMALPLKSWKKLRQPSGEAFTVMFKYERLNSFCFVCGRLGHTEQFCEELFKHEIAPDKRVSSIGTVKWLRDGLTSPGMEDSIGTGMMAAVNVKDSSGA
ncbi:hypothetical protein ACS0TY_010226 [Phlomoides rotata]